MQNYEMELSIVAMENMGQSPAEIVIRLHRLGWSDDASAELLEAIEHWIAEIEDFNGLD